MNITLHPSLGIVLGVSIAIVMIACAIIAIILHTKRTRAHSTDESMSALVRRVLMCVLVAVMALTPCTVIHTTSKAINATDVVIATDITGSMAVHDAQYGSSETISRLDAAKQAIDEITSLYANSSFAALSFGKSATVDVPLTPDARAVRTWAQSLYTEPTQNSSGSSLDAPLDQLIMTLKSIHQAHPDDKIVLFVISDGEQTSPATRRTFSSLRQYVDDACVLGVGSKEGGKIPQSSITHSGNDQQFVMDPQTGQPGISRLDEKSLHSIADELSGSFLALGNNTRVDDAQLAAISQHWRNTTTTKQRTRYAPIVWPLSIALTLLLAWELGAWIAASRRML